MAQLAIQVQNLLRLIGLNVQDLASLASLGDIMATVQELEAMAAEAQAIYGQLDGTQQGWNALINPAALPKTLSALWVWTQQASMIGLGSSRGAGAAFQTVIDSAIRLLQSMFRIIGMISTITGSVGGLQVLSGLVMSAVGALDQLKLLVLPYQQVLLGEALIEQVSRLASPFILAEDMRHWGQP